MLVARDHGGRIKMAGPNSSESFAQIAPDSTGKKIRNLAIDVVQPDGTASTVYMQVVSIADENGRPYSLSHEMPTSDNETNQHLARIVELLENLSLVVGA